MISAVIGLLQEDTLKIFSIFNILLIISLGSEHGSVIMGVRQVTQRSLVQASLWLPLLDVYCARQGSFSTLFSLPR